MNTFLGGWSLNAIASLQSGMPVTQATNSNAFAGFVIQRPNIVGDVNLPPDQRTPGRFFNTSAFATTPQFAIGNASRNPVRGPAYRDLDLGPSEAHETDRTYGYGTSRRDVRCNEYSGIRTAGRQLRDTSVRQHHQHCHRSAGDSVRY